MYRYDEFDHRLVAERIRQFRRQVRRRLAGELNEDQFKPLRLMNGLYLQLHAYMLRVNIPYGVLSSRQMRRLARIARRYDRGFGHFTTRQNVQFNWIRLEETPDLLEELAEVEMNAMQSSGNCVRNVTSDPYAGRARDEVMDPRPWCELIRQHTMLHPEFSYLPRKFKIAVTGSPRDRAAVAVHDIGLRMHRDARGEPGFEVLVGGGQGRTPVIGKRIRAWLEPGQVLSYIEAIMRVYNLYGRRDNIHKARIKILVNRLGIERYRERVEAEWAAMDGCGGRVPREEIARVAACFAPPPYETLADSTGTLAAPGRAEPGFESWMRRNVVAHRAPGYAIVNLTLKSPGHPPGDLDAERMDAVADLAERYSFAEIRVTHRQNLVFPDVRQSDLHALWQVLRTLELATPNLGRLTDLIACPGLDYCSLANARSIPVALDIGRHFAGSPKVESAGELSINVSGCMNACGHHHVGNIGILGVDKRGREFFQLTLGGSSERDAALGERLGPGLPRDEVPGAIEAVTGVYLRLREDGERFVETCRRVGIAPFRAAVYGAPKRTRDAA